MQRRRLGGSGVVVSDICMGTMTFGTQCDESTSHAICDRAWEAGIDFFDAAELYPVPPSAELYGVTEEILGRWLKTKPREAVIVATNTPKWQGVSLTPCQNPTAPQPNKNRRPMRGVHRPAAD